MGSAAAAFGVEHHRQLVFAGDAEHAVLLLVVLAALGAGEHGVVVGHCHAAGVLFPHEVAVDTADAHHHRVGGRLDDALFEFLEGVGAVAGGGDEGAELEEGAFVAEVVDVLACGALAGVVALGGGFGAGLVGGELVEVLHFGHVRADGV